MAHFESGSHHITRLAKLFLTAGTTLHVLCCQNLEHTQYVSPAVYAGCMQAECSTIKLMRTPP